MQVNHPYRPGITKNVPDEIVQRWLDHGWTEAEVEVASPEGDDVEGNPDDDADLNA